jgi:hypothetical protein
MQDFNILFDTGSSLFWVISADNCKGNIGGKDTSCPGQYKYLPGASKTFRSAHNQMAATTEYGYLSNTFLNCSIIGSDNLYIGHKLVYQNHPICSAYYVQINSTIAEELPYDGIMGLGLKNDDTDAIVNVVTTFIPAMYII